LTEIDGIDILTAQIILSEIGLDTSAWPTVKHFTSWLGLAPNNKITGGKVISSRTKKVKSRAHLAFRLAAQSLSRSNNSALGSFYRRMRAKHGGLKANVAAAHKLARIVYFMLKNRTPYHDPGADYYEQQYRKRAIKNLKRKAKTLGLTVVEAGQA
jgi:transposase